MKKTTKKLIKLTSKEILFIFFDFAAVGVEAFFHRNKDIVNSIRKYHKKREIDKIDFNKKIWRYKKEGFIQEYADKKYKLTKKGQKHTVKYLSEYIKFPEFKNWDQLWRIVVFDIPEEQKYYRDVLRMKLKQLGFYQLQKSVWVHPFDCSDIINVFKKLYHLQHFILFIVAKEVETDINLVDYFYNNNIFNKK